MKEISVCIVDDNRDLRNALEEIINMSEGYQCIGPSVQPKKQYSRYLYQTRCGIDGYQPRTEETGIDCVRVLKPRIPATNFMMCTVYEEDEKIFEALKRRRQWLYFKENSSCTNAGSYP